MGLDERRVAAEVEREEEMDVEKTRKWKFRFLDLMVEMLVDESGMTGEEVGNVLFYAEVAVEGFREKLQGNGNGKAVGDDSIGGEGVMGSGL